MYLKLNLFLFVYFYRLIVLLCSSPLRFFAAIFVIPKFRSTLVKHFLQVPEQQKVAQDFAMSDFSLTLVLQFKTSKIINGMANISIKSQEITPFGGIFHVMEKLDRYIDPVINGELGLRCTTFGYQYSEIARSLMSVYFCGGDCESQRGRRF